MIDKCCLITGANGFLGTALVKRLQTEYSSVKCAVRTLGKNKNSNGNVIEIGSINSTTDWKASLVGVDVIVHTAARVHVMSDESLNPLEEYRETNTFGTINLAKQAVESGVKRFIFISTIKVNGESTLLERPFKADDPREPQDFYGQSKAEAEEQLLELSEQTGLEVVIIRPPLIYGPGVKANFASLLKLVNRGIPLPFDRISMNARSLISITNLVDLISCCIDHPKAINQVFLASDDHDLSTREIIINMSKALKKTNTMFPIPVLFYRIAGKMFKKEDACDRLIGSLQLDITHTKELLNWIPPQKVEDGFKETVTTFIKRIK
tara:strand:- start:249 stop:1217 length:969 start_codon:yes stop_codon:yes gene_type:complete